MAHKMTKPASKVRLFLVDDEPSIRRGVEILLGACADRELCGWTESVAGALQLIPELDPQLVLVDLTLKGDDGFELIRRLRQLRPGLKILVFSMHNEPVQVLQAFEAGAHGYVPKDEGPERLLEGIEALLTGRCYVAPALAARLPDLRRRLESGGA